jgi:hypothetical protein
MLRKRPGKVRDEDGLARRGSRKEDVGTRPLTDARCEIGIRCIRSVSREQTVVGEAPHFGVEIELAAPAPAEVARIERE